MKYLINQSKNYYSIVILTVLFFSACKIQTFNNEASKSKHNCEDFSKNDTTPRVTGIGGIFFISDDPTVTKDWYSKNLGLSTNEYGSVFEFRNANCPEETNYLIWSIFNKNSTYFEPSKKDFMINYRVQNIESLVKKLQTNGVTILDTIAIYDYGKFIHIIDPEGNKIELWEPVDSNLTKLGGKTTK